MHIRTNLKPASIFALILVVFAFLVQLIVYLLNWVRSFRILRLGKLLWSAQGAPRRIAGSQPNCALRITSNPPRSGSKTKNSY